MKRLYLLLSFYFLLLHTQVFADHLIGGEISYKYVGLGSNINTQKYNISLKSYTTSCTPTAQSEENIYIYVNDTIYTAFKLQLDSFNFIESPEFECFNIPLNNDCIKERVYSAEIELPIISESYYLVFQRCCRVEDITNIFLDNTAMTYLVEISPLAQLLKNSSPVFLELPPTVVCVNENINLSINTQDIDGDFLIYSLCAPLEAAPSGLIIQPLPPPYPLVTFIAPEYTPQQPFGQSANITLDPYTGTLTGSPNTLGIFVVGICVEEYRNGQLLSTINRDFQFNVEYCPPYVVANLESNHTSSQGENIYNICNGESLTIQNESYDTNHINQFYWLINMPNGTDTLYDWNPTLEFSESGIFTGQLILNPTQECTDTANIIIHVNELLQADYQLTYDTCIGGEVSFTSQSISQGGNIIDWFWDFGDSTNSYIEHPQHQYLQPGNQAATLIITNEYSCKDTVTKNFDWLPAPPIIVVAPNTFEGCSPLSVYFENLSIPVDSTYDIIWDFGNGEMSTAISPSYIYENEGIFDITVSITSPIGCEIDTTFTHWIKVVAAPHTDFNWEEDLISNFMPEAHFNDLSTQAIAWKWELNNEVFAYDQNPSFIFQDTGYQTVTLTVFDQYNCQDSLTLMLDVAPAFTYFLPNAFSPNGDGVNDIFKGKGFLENIESFEMIIFNRWGALVFQTNNPEMGWDGRNIKTGKLASQGVYNCWVKYKAARKPLQEIQQAVVLIK